MHTYTLYARPEFNTVVKWAGGPMPSKHATARELRFKARHRRRR